MRKAFTWHNTFNIIIIIIVIVIVVVIITIIIIIIIIVITDVQSVVCANDRINYIACGPCSFVCALHYHYHHYADLSEGSELLKCLPGIYCQVGV